jgi:5-methylcytosine-specific restriction protein A
MKAKICAEPSCNTIIPVDLTYCEKHKKDKRIPFKNAIRSNDGLYNTSQWKKLRKKILKKQPHCSKCGVNIKLEIHHIIPPRGNEELFYNENNLIVICEQCHRVLTSKEIRNRHLH